jgi:hypothetical protein
VLATARIGGLTAPAPAIEHRATGSVEQLALLLRDRAHPGKPRDGRNSPRLGGRAQCPCAAGLQPARTLGKA